MAGPLVVLLMGVGMLVGVVTGGRRPAPAPVSAALAAEAALVLVAPLAAVLLGWSGQALLIPAGLRAGSDGAGRP